MNHEIELNDELWARVDSDIITIGIKQEVIEDINEIWGLDLPEEGGEVTNEEVCGELETDDGPINLYSPVEGEVIDVNTAVSSDPDLLKDDSVIEGWLIKVQAFNSEDLEGFLNENAPDELSDTEDDE